MNTRRIRPGVSLQPGFTLVEVLVVLVMVSMLSVVLIDGIVQVLQIQSRLAEKTALARESSLERAWFRQVLRGTIADKDHEFSLRSREISGLTVDPLLSAPGVPMPYRLALRSVGSYLVLEYREQQGDPVELARWLAADATESFSFDAVEDSGKTINRWPEPGSRVQLPLGVGLRLPLARGEQRWQVAMLGRREPKLIVTEDTGI